MKFNKKRIILVLLGSFVLGSGVDLPPSETKPSKKVIYQEGQTIDFEGLSLEGELKTPGEFYFQNRNQDRFDTLTKRRLNFRREMLRDSVQSN